MFNIIKVIYKNRIDCAIFALVITLSGCANIPDSREVNYEHIKENRENIKQLKIGMHQDEVLQIMGKPQDFAPGPKQARHLSYWLYQTISRDLTSWALNGSNFTWVAFEEDKLVAIGASHEVIPLNKKHPLWRPQ